MKKTVQNLLREEYNRLKKAIEKIINTKQGNAAAQPVLQPVRQKKY